MAKNPEVVFVSMPAQEKYLGRQKCYGFLENFTDCFHYPS